MSDFRHLDVDQYNEEALHPLELVPMDPRSPQELLQLAQAKQNSVRTRLASRDIAGALSEALRDPPTGEQAIEARTMTLGLVLDILNSASTADISPALKALRIDERDTLMKYLYRGMELGRTSGADVNCSVLLSWHEKVCGLS